MNPEYPAAVGYLQAKVHRPRLVGGIHRVVLHITDGRSPHAEDAARYFHDDPDKRLASAHFIVGANGEVWQGVAIDDVAFHAKSANADSIGIEHCARSRGEFGHDDPGMPLTAEQYAASARLVAWLCDRLALPRDRAHILGHFEADASSDHRDCPTGQLDWPRYLAALALVPPFVAC